MMKTCIETNDDTGNLYGFPGNITGSAAEVSVARSSADLEGGRYSGHPRPRCHFANGVIIRR